MTVQVARSGRVLEVTLDRPAKRNALNSDMIATVTSAVLAAGADDSLAAVVLRGAGTHFCAGADISEYHGVPVPDLLGFTRRARVMCEAISSCPVPVVAAVQGLALGGGMELCLASDFVLAHTSASFGLPELRLGLIPGWGGTQRLPALIGQQAARHLVFTSGRLDAHEGKSLGLVARVCTEEIDAALEPLLASITSQSRGALVAAKRALTAAGTREGPDLETDLLMERFRHPDGVEGVAAFVERRSAVFTDGPQEGKYR